MSSWRAQVMDTMGRSAALPFLCAWLFLFAGAGEVIWAADRIVGAGATFPYPIYAKWAYAYAKETGVKLNYQSIGSGGGIQQIKAGTVDFGASDAALSAAELDEAGLLQFPMIVGGVVPVVNLKGVPSGAVRLTGEVLAAIFLGEVTKWDDERIKALNLDVALPSKRITVVHRSDGSGTTWIFTTYLSQLGEAWKTKVGAGKAVKWPVGVGGKGNEGVAVYVKRIDGGIGYVEYAYAKQNKLSVVALSNREGEFVLPTAETFRATAQNADWAGTPGFAVVLTNQAGKDSWPITGASFILMQRTQHNRAKCQQVLRFFEWCLRNGQEMALSLDYIPLPELVARLVEHAWETGFVAEGGAVWPIR